MDPRIRVSVAYHFIMRKALSLAALVAGCARGPAPPLPAEPREGAAAVAPLAADASDAPDAHAPDAQDAVRAQIDPDGNDDPEDTGPGALPAHGRLVRVGRAPLALTRICDLTPFAGALYAAHANVPLGTDGATITRYDPSDAKRPFAVAFDWNRPGEPTRGGGAGQGFLRVHAIGGRLFVPDSDPPYAGFGLVDPGTEGYVFVSDRAGRFAPARAPHFRPPQPPDGEDRPGAGVVPRGYHDLDAIRFRGRFYVSTGAVPPTERAWRGPSPGALHVANADLSRWVYEVDYPFPWQNGVWRLTFMVRFRDRLYAGIQDYDARDPYDYVLFDPPPGSTAISRKDAHPVSVVGTAATLRWTVDASPGHPPRLYWIAGARDGVRLRVTEDGDEWREIDLPADAGRPTDVTRFRDALVVLTERRLLRLGDDGAIAVVATVDEKKSPFELGDFFCAAPLAVYQNELYAGGQRDGALYKLAAE
jgi:hypothetical protein